MQTLIITSMNECIMIMNVNRIYSRVFHITKREKKQNTQSRKRERENEQTPQKKQFHQQQQK